MIDEINPERLTGDHAPRVSHRGTECVYGRRVLDIVATLAPETSTIITAPIPYSGTETSVHEVPRQPATPSRYWADMPA